MYVRHIRTPLSPRDRVPDNLIDMRIWWLNVHQPASDGTRMWVPQLGCVHTLAAPPAACRPPPSQGAKPTA